jgi:hypothetical protein
MVVFGSGIKIASMSLVGDSILDLSLSCFVVQCIVTVVVTRTGTPACAGLEFPLHSPYIDHCVAALLGADGGFRC